MSRLDYLRSLQDTRHPTPTFVGPPVPLVPASEPAGTPAVAAPGVEDDRLQHIIQVVHDQLVHRASPEIIDRLTPDQRRRHVSALIDLLLAEEPELLTAAEREQAAAALRDEALGYGPLEQLLRDPDISDILVNGARQVYVERRGKLEKSPVRFRDDDHLLEVIRRIVSRVGRRVDESSPMVDARLEDKSRLNAIIPPLSLTGPMLSIRRFGARRLTMLDLVGVHALTPEMARFLEAAVRARRNILVSGGTGTGHEGSMSTLHANSPRDALSRLEMMVMMSGLADLPLRAIRQQMASTVHLVVQLGRLAGGQRKVTSITEVVGMEQETVLLEELFGYRQHGLAADGAAVGSFACRGVRPRCAEHLAACGIDLPPDLFQERVLLTV